MKRFIRELFGLKAAPLPILKLDATRLTPDELTTFLRNFDARTASPQSMSDMQEIILHTFSKPDLLRANLTEDVLKAFDSALRSPRFELGNLMEGVRNSQQFADIMPNPRAIGEYHPEALSEIGRFGLRTSRISEEESVLVKKIINDNFDLIKDSPATLKGLADNIHIDQIRVFLAENAEHFAARHPDVAIHLLKPHRIYGSSYVPKAEVTAALADKMPKIAQASPENTAKILRQTDIIDAVKERMPAWMQDGTVDANHPLSRILSTVSAERGAFVQSRAIGQSPAAAAVFTP